MSKPFTIAMITAIFALAATPALASEGDDEQRTIRHHSRQTVWVTEKPAERPSALTGETDARGDDAATEPRLRPMGRSGYDRR